MVFVLSVNAQVRFGIKAGINLPNVTAKSDGTKEDTKMSFGFHVGTIADWSLSESFSVQPGLLFSTKGFKTTTVMQGISVDITETVNYLEIPINAMYKLPVGSAKILIFGGPYFGYALSGKAKGTAMGVSDTQTLHIGSSDTDDLKAMDLGLNFGAGVEISNFVVTAQYGLGLANLSPDTSFTEKNNVIGISVGFLIGGK